MANSCAEQVKKDEALLALPYDENAVSELIARYRGIVEFEVKKFARNDADRDDLIQEGMLGLLSAIRTFYAERQVKFSTYASKCVKNRIITAVNKSNKADMLLISEDFEIADSTLSPEEEYLLRERVCEISEKIRSSLSQLEKNVLFMNLMGKSYEQTAEKFCVSIKTVDNALQRARKKLKTIFKTV